MDKAVLNQLLHRSTNANKYDFGHVLILGGSEGTVGAALLCAKATLRIGAGMATIAAPAGSTSRLERRVEEVMTLTLPENTDQALKTLFDFTAKRQINTIVVGPGLPPHLGQLCRQFLSKVKQPVVLDAAGITAFSNHKDELSAIADRIPVVTTPHSGEYQKFTGETLIDDEQDVNQAVSRQAQKLNATIVLKGHNTLVAYPNGQLYRNSTGNPGMATAGSGDVLAGIIAGLLAQKVSIEQATLTGVYLHGLAGDIAKKAKTEPGMIAGDIIENLPNAIKQLAKEESIAL